MSEILTNADLLSNISTFIADNTTRQISESDVRERFNEIAKSLFSSVDGTPFIDYNGGTVYNEGDGVYYNDAVYKKINGTASGQLPTNVAHWELISGSPIASTSRYGLAKIASQAEVDAGTIANKFVTPQTLANTAFGGANDLSDLSDVDTTLTTLISGYTLFWNSNTLQFEADELMEIASGSEGFLQFFPQSRELQFDGDGFGFTENNMLAGNATGGIKELTSLTYVENTLANTGVGTVRVNDITQLERLGLTPIDGDIVYDSDADSIYAYTSGWRNISKRYYEKDLIYISSTGTTIDTEYVSLYGLVNIENLVYDITEVDEINIQINVRLSSTGTYTALTLTTTWESAINAWIGANITTDEQFYLEIYAPPVTAGANPDYYYSVIIEYSK